MAQILLEPTYIHTQKKKKTHQKKPQQKHRQRQKGIWEHIAEIHQGHIILDQPGNLLLGKHWFGEQGKSSECCSL